PLLASVERHEVQHRLDYGRPRPLPMPAQLAAFVGPLRASDGTPHHGAARSLAELSAYLAELARDRQTVRTGLSVLAQFLIMPAHWGTAECYAAIVLLEELTRELAIEGASLVQGGEIDRMRVTDLYLALTAMPPDTVRAAARRL